MDKLRSMSEERDFLHVTSEVEDETAPTVLSVAQSVDPAISLETVKALLFKLHELGVAWYYGDEPTLENVLILDPQWIVNASVGLLPSPLLHHSARANNTPP